MTRLFHPHGWCFLWDPGVLWLTVLSDAVITFAYWSIPALLYVTLRNRVFTRSEQFLIWTFIAFIFLCGLTHLMDIITIWNPVYYVAGVVKLATAAVSIVSAVVLTRAVSSLLRFLESANAEGDYAAIISVLQRLRSQAKRHASS